MTCKRAVEAALAVIPGEGGLSWLEEPCAVSTPVLSLPRPGRVALRMAELTMVLLDDRDQLRKTMPLMGEPVEQIGAWLKTHGIEDDISGSSVIPAVDKRMLLSLEHWIANGQSTLRYIARQTQGSSAVTIRRDPCAVCLEIELPTRQGEPRRALEFQMGWVDGGPTPAIVVDALPSEERWLLSESTITSESDGDAQAKTVADFLVNSLERAYASVQREWRPRRPD